MEVVIDVPKAKDFETVNKLAKQRRMETRFIFRCRGSHSKRIF